MCLEIRDKIGQKSELNNITNNRHACEWQFHP